MREPKCEMINIRVRKVEKAELMRIAKLKGMKLSEYLRRKLELRK